MPQENWLIFELRICICALSCPRVLDLVGLVLAMSLVLAEDNLGPYNPVADVNKDGIVDILADLLRIAFYSLCDVKTL
jgi:hypothetical protein